MANIVQIRINLDETLASELFEEASETKTDISVIVRFALRRHFHGVLNNYPDLEMTRDFSAALDRYNGIDD